MKNLMLLSLVMGSFFAVKQFNVDLNANKSEKKTFEEFLNQFETAELPFVLDHEDLIPKTDPYNWETAETFTTPEITLDYAAYFPHVERRRFSRMGPDTYFFEKKLVETEEFILVLYSQSRPMTTMKESYTMATYTKEGKIIDELHFANAFGLEEIAMASIDENFEITRTDATVKWKEAPYSIALTENEITEIELEYTDIFRIAKNGKFIEDEDIDTDPIPIKKEQVALDNA